MPHKPGRFDILETDLPVIWVLCQRDGFSLVTGLDQAVTLYSAKPAI